VTVEAFGTEVGIEMIKEDRIVGRYWELDVTKMTRAIEVILGTCSATVKQQLG
jgi:hypothetical protein